MFVLGKSNYKVGTGTGSVVARICCTQCTVADTLKIPLLWYYVGQGLCPCLHCLVVVLNHSMLVFLQRIVIRRDLLDNCAFSISMLFVVNKYYSVNK